MKLWFSSWLVLIPIILVGYQNCSNFAADPSLSKVSFSSNAGNGFDTPYTDGLAAGITQSGSLFARDPSSAAGNTCLPFTASLAPYAVSANITHLVSGSTLSDGYVTLQSANMTSNAGTLYQDKFPGQDASPAGSLSYDPSNARFDQVSAYYHTDRVIGELTGASLLTSAMYTPIKIFAHCKNAPDNAFFSYTEHILCLGYSSAHTGVYGSQDADVTIHEFGHSLNHTYSTDDILGSTPDMGAMDEAFADLWAYRSELDPRISLWYGRAIDTKSCTNYPGLRNLDDTPAYPTYLTGEVHNDSTGVSSMVKFVEASASMDATTKAKFEKHLLEGLKMGDGFSDVLTVLQDEAPSFGVSTSSVNTALQARGLYRKDNVAELQFDTTPFAVIDNHGLYYSGGSGTPLLTDSGGSNVMNTGNCNGTLDAGETVILVPRLKNTGAAKGGVVLKLSSTTSGVTVYSGFDTGFQFRVGQNTTFIPEIATYDSNYGVTKGSLDYWYFVLPSAFLVKVNAGVTSATFQLQVQAMNTIDTTPSVETLSTTVATGSTATAATCTQAQELSVDP